MVIIGAGTTVTFQGKSDICVLSVNWGYNPNVQRLWCLGTSSPFMTIYRPTESLSVTLYSGVTDSVGTTASTTCADAGLISATVDPATCETNAPKPLSVLWYLAGYSYSKDDPNMPGQETWSLEAWLAGPNGEASPTRVVRNIAEGSSTPLPTDPEYPDQYAFTGIVFQSGSATIKGTSGSVSANSFGNADVVTYGIVTSVGDSPNTAAEMGKTGQGSVSIPLQPLYF